MEKMKKLRTPLRASFTKSVNALEDVLKFEVDESHKPNLQASLDSIERKADRIAELDKDIIEALVKNEATEEGELANECEGISEYEDKLYLCRRKVETALAILAEKLSSVKAASEYESASSAGGKKSRKYKLPKIELTKFGGEIKDWLAFWAQFRKIHVDDDLADEDKFHYLRQSTIENSKAREVVDSFPMTAENYQKVIRHLESRFGNKDTLVEVYVRELLKLVLVNALNPTKKMVISTLYDKLEAQLRALESLEVTRDKFVAILYPLVESCLPEELLRAWERHRIIPMRAVGSETKIDRLSHLMLFLQGEVESEERILLARSGFGEQAKKSQKKEEESYDIPTVAGLFVGSSIRKKTPNCLFCCKPHYSNQCSDAKKMTLIERQKIVEDNKACYACLGKGHWFKECNRKYKIKCRNCNGQHDQLMCRGNSRETKDTNKETGSESNSEVVTETQNLLVKDIYKEETVLSTLMIRIRNGGKMIVVRAAIDSGSTKTYMLKRLIAELGLIKNGEEKLFHELFGGHRTTETVHGRFTVSAENLDGSFRQSFDVLEQEQICCNVSKIPKGPWMDELIKRNIVLSDVGAGNSEIQLLIGGNIAGKLLKEILKLDQIDSLVAMNYSLGWTIMGQVPGYSRKDDKVLLTHSLFVRDSNVSDLWRLDVIGIEDAAETRKKEKCMEVADENFQKTLTVNEEGRYEIALPFINGCPSLGSNKTIAERRLVSMSKKLQPELRAIYQKVFDDWEADGIIEEVPVDQLDDFGHYLPHKAVLKPNSLTTPVRPVFDASAKEKESLSLNESLLTGPNLLEVITSVVIRFRMRKYGIIADIKKAFLQISIRPEDRNYLRFLWWERNSEDKVKVYRHRRVVFGMTCSSFLLAATINHILDKAPVEYEATAKQLKNSNYVDNCVTSLDDEAAISRFKNQSTAMLSTGKFELRGWESNCLQSFEKKTSVLGLTWDLTEDSLTCDIDKGYQIGDTPISKRDILATAHQIFDPIGFTVPITICPKQLLQDCWEAKISWDVAVPTEISRKFRKWCQQLSEIKKVTIPRWIGCSSVNMNLTSLHVFADASKSAYAACVFIRIEEESGVKIQLIQAKTRIAPLKKLSINRLELLGCLIGARLSDKVKHDMSLIDIQCTYWTDSSNTLHWITNDDQWGTYVWNRVEEIKRLTDVCSWRYVPGAMNPADLPSRGCTPSQLVESSWWEGPEWLKLPDTEWPKAEIGPDDDAFIERKNVVICAWERARVRADTSWISNLNVDYAEMVRFVAIMKRLISNRGKPYASMRKAVRIYGIVSVIELDNAEKHILLMIQNEAFVSNDPVLNKMELVQDEQRILRVKTKILLRDDTESFRTPAVLPNKHPLVNAIIEHCHRENSHAGTATVMAILREKFWIIKSRVAVKRIVKKCFVCKMLKAKPFVTEPAQLPMERVRDAAVFEVSGVDLTGHLFLSDGSKAWIVLYTCAVYRAVYLDLVPSLNTDSFMNSLRRFVARKIRPKIIYSDKGTNLTGTENCLKEVDWEKIQENATARRIDWRFIPSKGPWWGGWWERLIGVIKDVLKRVLGKANLTHDEMITVLSECESIVNARPLTYMAEDTSELETLTPAMFLKDIVEDGVPDLDAVNAKKLNQRLRYRLRLKEDLRKRFRSEYIGQLVHRKGGATTRQIEIGELVLIKDKNIKRVFWPIARVIKIHLGKDGVIRVAEVKTAKGVLERPVKLLIPLEIRQDENVMPLGVPIRFQEEILALRTSPTPKQSKTPKASKVSKPSIVSEAKLVDPKSTRSGRVVKPTQRFGHND